jgi:hypothetical protein
MRLLVLALAFISGVCHAYDIDGLWVGYYEYTLREKPARVEFSLVLKSDGSKVVGKMMERNTFGDKQVIALFANINGVVDGQTIKFYKTYDGSGSVNHSVLYELNFANEHRLARGTWTIGERSTGLVEILKIEL